MGARAQSRGLWGRARGGDRGETYHSTEYLSASSSLITLLPTLPNLDPCLSIIPPTSIPHPVTQPNAHAPGSAAVFQRATNPSCPSAGSLPPLSQHSKSKDHSYTHSRLTHTVDAATSAPSSSPSPHHFSRPASFFACLAFSAFLSHKALSHYHGCHDNDEQESCSHRLQAYQRQFEPLESSPARHHTITTPSSASRIRIISFRSRPLHSSYTAAATLSPRQYHYYRSRHDRTIPAQRNSEPGEFHSHFLSCIPFHIHLVRPTLPYLRPGLVSFYLLVS